MNQNETSILTPRIDSRTGLVSLEALERIAAQLRAPRRKYRVTIVNCETEQYEKQALEPDAVAAAH